jgi:hypothetical protein
MSISGHPVLHDATRAIAFIHDRDALLILGRCCCRWTSKNTRFFWDAMGSGGVGDR